jgi:putative hydrolase of the HAD superfamily
LNGAPVERTRPDPAIRGLILDYGEVLCRRPAPGYIDRMATAAGLDAETFAARYQQERGPYDRGDYSPREYWSRVVRDAAALSEERIDRLRRWDVEMWSDLDGAMIDWLCQAHEAGFRTAVLSNMHADMAAHVRHSYGWLQCLDYAVLSCEVRLIKPDPAIYQRCLEGLGLPAAEVCFIDDREVNVDGARAVGLSALRFQGVECLRNDLRAIGIALLPEPASHPPRREAACE